MISRRERSTARRIMVIGSVLLVSVAIGLALVATRGSSLSRPIVGSASAVGYRSGLPGSTTSTAPPAVPTTLTPPPTTARVTDTLPPPKAITEPAAPVRTTPAHLPSSATTTTGPGPTMPPIPTTVPLPPVPPTSPPSSVNPPSNATQDATGTWHAVSNGITISLKMEPAAPAVGETVHFVMTATSASKDCCITSFYPGDGIVVPPAAGPVNCSNSQPSSYSQETDHVYARPGDFMVEVQPSILGLCWGNPNSVVNATMFVPVTVVASGT